MHDFDDEHHRRHAEGWRRFEQFARRGFRGFGGFPGWEGLEGNFRIGRMLASGDLRLVALFLIEQQPRHGYDLIKAIEERTNGFYSPSPGIVYPALTYLEEAGFVSASQDGNKKLYAITDEGRAHLNENRAAVDSTLGYLGKIGGRWAEMRQKFADREEHHERRFYRGGEERPDRDLRDVIPAVNEARRSLKAAIAEALPADPEVQQRLAEILEKAARKIRELGRKTDDVDI